MFPQPKSLPVHRRTRPATDPAALLDQVEADLRSQRVSIAVSMLFSTLVRFRREMTDAEWQSFVAEVCLVHPLRSLLHEDPLTARAFSRPRGYPGDAGTLDYIYGRAALPAETTSFGRHLYAEISTSEASRSVRWRRDLLACYIDRVGQQVAAPRILSVACGYLREAERSRVVETGAFDTFLALDQDEDCVQLLQREQTPRGVSPRRASVRALLAGRVTECDLDLIYAAGLYDYLGQPAAVSLTTLLFSKLRPGGRLLIANFTARLPDSGYMEAFMRWRLIYRDGKAMKDLLNGIDRSEIATQRLFSDPLRNVLYVDVVKR